MIPLTKGIEPPQPWAWWHWQNLNDKKDGTQGSGWRHGRCWWHFRARKDQRGPSGPTIEFSWNFWTHFCGIGFDIDDEALTLSIACPPVAFWLSFSTNWWLVNKLAPKILLSKRYGTPPRDPDYLVINERECAIRIHNGCIWINPWSKKWEHVKADPWWVRGITLHVNPFEARHQRHEVRRADGSWVPSVGSWERGKDPDQKECLEYPYRYVLKNGTIQERTATVSVERRAWRPRAFQWTSLFEKEITSIDVQFSDEVGEESGSWKGGCIGCGYDLRPGETALEALRRMERERKF